MYRKRSFKINTLIIISCLLYIGLEFGLYYFTDSAAAVFFVALAGGLLLTHVFLEAAFTYDVCFLFTLFSAVPASILSLLIYLNQNGHLLIYHNFLPYLLLLHWLLPICYCTVRCLFDRGPRFVHYNSFFLKMGLLFGAYYVPALIVRTFFIPLEFPYTFTGKEISLFPFLATATHIEDFIYTGVGIEALLVYVLSILFLFLPLGFYGSILLRSLPALLKAFFSIALPLLFEGITWLLKGSFIMDACIYRLLGILFGILLYQLINHLFRIYTHTDFLYERNRYSFF